MHNKKVSDQARAVARDARRKVNWRRKGGRREEDGDENGHGQLRKKQDPNQGVDLKT